jgi:hypothetical protein
MNARTGQGKDGTRRHEVFRNIERLGTGARIFAVGAAACGVVGLAACSATGGTPAPTATKTVTQAAPASPAAASNSPAAAASTPAKGSGGTADASAAGKLPDYKPSTVVSKSAGSTILTSSGSVHKIGAFYRKALAAGGWHVASSSMGPYHASFTADRGNEGVSISVYPSAGGSGISISTHPR